MNIHLQYGFGEDLDTSRIVAVWLMYKQYAYMCVCMYLGTSVMSALYDELVIRGASLSLKRDKSDFSACIHTWRYDHTQQDENYTRAHVCVYTCTHVSCMHNIHTLHIPGSWCHPWQWRARIRTSATTERSCGHTLQRKKYVCIYVFMCVCTCVYRV
jgi:hypothetical protein